MHFRKLLSSRLFFLIALLCSWVGMVVHNRVELPMMPLLSMEYMLTTGLYVILLAGWLLQPEHRHIWTWLLFFWVAMHFVVGAWLSVLPLSIWPFDPEQSVRHYLAHVLYGAAQGPLLWRLISDLRSPQTPDLIR